MAETDVNRKVNIVTLTTSLVRVFFTNMTGEETQLIEPNGTMEYDSIFVPPGVSSLCYCPIGPFAINPNGSKPILFAFSSDIKLEIIGHSGPECDSVYIHITKYSTPPSLRDLSMVSVRELISEFHILDQKIFEKLELPSSLSVEICETSLDLRSEKVKLKYPQKHWSCVCKNPLSNNCHFKWRYDMRNLHVNHKSRRIKRRSRK
jgi:hypothetical protein